MFGAILIYWLMLCNAFMQLYTAFGTQFDSHSNQPPEVTLILSEDIRTVTPGQQLTYSVAVSDHEDGSSKYLEIPGNQVYVEVRHFIDKSAVDRPNGENIALMTIKEANCFDCHQWKADLVGPAMNKIIAAYRPNTSGQLVSSLIQGSVGKWGEEMMPAQGVSSDQAQEIVTWLLGSQPKSIVNIFRGLDGLFVANSNIEKGYYLLTASYRDKGTGAEMSNRLTGYYSILLTIDD